MPIDKTIIGQIKKERVKSEILTGNFFFSGRLFFFSPNANFIDILTLPTSKVYIVVLLDAAIIWHGPAFFNLLIIYNLNSFVIRFINK